MRTIIYIKYKIKVRCDEEDMWGGGGNKKEEAKYIPLFFTLVIKISP